MREVNTISYDGLCKPTIIRKDSHTKTPPIHTACWKRWPTELHTCVLIGTYAKKSGCWDCKPSGDGPEVVPWSSERKEFSQVSEECHAETLCSKNQQLHSHSSNPRQLPGTHSNPAAPLHCLIPWTKINKQPDQELDAAAREAAIALLLHFSMTMEELGIW